MTEYDYSPEAYENYLAKQGKVKKWATDTSLVSHEYVHPFQEIVDHRGEERPHPKSSGPYDFDHPLGPPFPRPTGPPLSRPPDHWSANPRFNKSSQSLHVSRPPERARNAPDYKRSQAQSHHRSHSSSQTAATSSYAPPVPNLPPNPYAAQSAYQQSSIAYVQGHSPFPVQQSYYAQPHVVSPQPVRYAYPQPQPVPMQPAKRGAMRPVTPAQPAHHGKQPPLLKRMFGGLMGRAKTPAPSPAPQPQPQPQQRPKSRSRSRRKSLPY